MSGDADRTGATDRSAGEQPAAAPLIPLGALAAAQGDQPATGRPQPAATPAPSSPPLQQPVQQSAMSEQVYVKPKKGPVRRFVRSLISHLVFAMIMVAAVFGWVFQTQIFSHLGDELCTDDRLGGYMTKARAPQAAPPAKLERPAAIPEASRSVAEKPVSPVSAPTSTAAIPVPPAVTSAAPVEAVKEATVRPQSAPHSSPVEPAAAPSEPVPGKLPDTVVAKPLEPARPMTAQPLPAAVPETASGSTQVAASPPPPAPEPASALMAEWQAARQAYAARTGDVVDAYRRLIAKHPNVIELRGELGNVLYGLGRMKEAAEQYYEAALQHLNGPEPGLATCLAEVIQRIDAERAKSLEEKTAGQACPYRRPQ